MKKLIFFLLLVISFSSFAYFNDFYMAQKYLANSFNTIEMQKISKELLICLVRALF